MKQLIALIFVFQCSTFLAEANQCISFYSNQSVPNIASAPSINVSEFGLAVLNSLNHYSGNHVPMEFYGYVKDTLKSQNGVGRDLDRFNDIKSISETSNETEIKTSEMYLKIEQDKIKLLEAVILFNKIKDSAKLKKINQDLRYEHLKSINELAVLIQKNMDELSRYENNLTKRLTELNHMFERVSVFENNYGQYLDDFKIVYGQMLMNQHNFPTAKHHLESLGHHFGVEISTATSIQEQIRSIKNIITTRKLTIENALKMSQRSHNITATELLVETSLSPLDAEAIIKEYIELIPSQEAKKRQQEEQKLKKLARANSLKKLAVQSIIGLSALFGAGYGIETFNDANIPKKFELAKQINDYVFYSDRIDDSRSHAKSRKSYAESPYFQKELIGLDDYPQEVVKFLKEKGKDTPLSPETVLYLSQYSGQLFKTLKYDTFMENSIALLDGFLSAPLTRNYTQEERASLIKNIKAIGSSYEGYFNFTTRETGFVVNFDVTAQKKVVDKYIIGKTLSLIRSPIQTSWSDAKAIEAAAEKYTDKTLKKIFEIRDQQLLMQALSEFVWNKSGNLNNLEMIYILKHSADINTVFKGNNVFSLVRNYRFLPETLLSLLSEDAKDIMDSSAFITALVLAVKDRSSESLRLAPMTAQEANLYKSYIESMRSNWSHGSPEYRDKMLSFLISEFGKNAKVID